MASFFLKPQTIFLILVFVCIRINQGHSQSFTTDGNWDDASNWSGSNIGDLITEDPSIDGHRSATIRDGFDYIVGDLTVNNSAAITIDSTGSLTIGASGNTKTLDIGSHVDLTVHGDLTVNGDFEADGTFDLHVLGSVTVTGNANIGDHTHFIIDGDLDINGNLTVGGSSDMDINGTMDIGGNYTSGSFSDIDVDGNLTVGGDLSTGSSSNLAGSGLALVTGGCTEGAHSTVCSSGTLPVSLLGFEAQVGPKGVQLSWNTATEINNDYFTVERSLDGVQFLEIGKVQGAGNSNHIRTYTLMDENPANGSNYYRLTQTDFNGTQETFPVIIANVQDLEEVSVFIYPIPSNGRITIQSEQPASVVIINAMGTIVTTGTTGNLDLSHLPSGSYIARIAFPDQTVIKRIQLR